MKEITIMKKIFTTKVSLQSSNPTFSYPIIRLPRELKELAGRIVNVYQTEIDGVQGFFVEPHLDKLDNLDKFDENNCEVNSKPKCGLINKSTPKTNGLGRIRTGDLRHVKATS
jgi:hypothetical protein